MNRTTHHYDEYGKKIVALEQKFEQTSSAVKEIRDMISARDEKLDKIIEKQKPNLMWIWQALGVLLTVVGLLLGLIIVPMNADIKDINRRIELSADKFYSLQHKDIEFQGRATAELESLQKDIDDLKHKE